MMMCESNSLILSYFPILKIDDSDITGSWQAWLEDFTLAMAFKKLELGKVREFERDIKGIIEREQVYDHFTPEMQLLVTLYCVGAEGRRTLRSMGYDVLNKGGNFEDVIELLKSYYHREENMYAKAHKFM